MNDFTFETLTPDNAAMLLDGYDVYAVMDASGMVNQHALMAAMFRMSHAGVKIATANMVIAEILADWLGKFAVPLGKLYSNRIPNFGFIAAHLQHQAKLSHAYGIAS
jgi:hypothetical protein